MKLGFDMAEKILSRDAYQDLLIVFDEVGEQRLIELLDKDRENRRKLRELELKPINKQNRLF